MKLASKKIFLIGLLLLIISTTFALLLTEWLIRRVQPQFTLKQAQLVSPRVFKKSKSIPSTLLENLDTQHIALTREFSSYYTTNSLGYRGPEFTPEKPADTYRILMLGDSITFGWGVEDNQTFSHLLAQQLNQESQGKKIEIINAGWYDGYAPDNYYVYLKTEGLKLNPDLVILNLFPWNDIADLREMVWSKTDQHDLPVKIKSTDRTVRGGYHVETVSSNWKFRIPILRNSHLAILAMTNLEQNSPSTVRSIKRLLRLPEPQTIPQTEVEACIYQQDCTQQMQSLWQKLDRLILGINRLLSENNTPLLINLLPAHTQTFPLAEEPTEEKVAVAQPQQRFRDFFEKNQLQYLDPLPYFLDQNYLSYFYPKDGHPTPVGHQRLATALADWFKDL
jgi:lysophospholipase L1-like esterase